MFPDQCARDWTVQVLKTDKNATVRWIAAQALVHCGEPPKDDIVRVMLQDLDQGVRNVGIGEAMTRPADEAVPLLITLLEKIDRYELDEMIEVITFLGESGDPRAVSPMCRVLEDSDYTWPGAEVAIALGNLGDPAAVDSLLKVVASGLPYTRYKAVEALGKIGDSRALGPLLQALKTNDPDTGDKSIEALGNIGDCRALGPLVTVLRTGQSEIVRNDAAIALGKIREPAAVPALIDALMEDDDDLVRLGAAVSLSAFGSKKSREALIKALEDEDWRVRHAVVISLGKIADPCVAGPLAQVLKEDESPVVRAGAAEALGRIGGSEIKRFLAGALQDKDEDVRAAAQYAIDSLPGKISS